MRFPRNAKIFRGQLDPAPVAGVFFLLMLFILLGSLLYTPGVLVSVAGNAGGKPVTVLKSGKIQFDGKTYKSDDPADLQQLRQDLGGLPVGEPVRLTNEAGAPHKVSEQIREMLLIEPPIAEGMLGTDNPVVMVAVNPRSQYFYENQLLTEAQLGTQLRSRFQDEARAGKSLTLVLLADKGVSEEVIVRLSALAAEVGIREVILSTRPGTFSMRPPR